MEKIQDTIREMEEGLLEGVLDLDKIHLVEEDIGDVMYRLYNCLFLVYCDRSVLTAKRLEILNEIYQASEKIDELTTLSSDLD